MMKLIIDKVRPYHGGNDLLVALHELDILDKHVVLIPTLKAIRIARISAKNPDGSQAFSFKNLTIGESGNLIQDAGIPGFSPPFMMISGYTVEQEKIDSTLEVVFGPNHPLARRNVVEALHEIRHTVSGIVDIFEAEIARADTT
jgi:hypothetical protein